MSERRVYVAASKADREWTLKRDDYQCRHPDDSILCNGELNVHHIIPGLYAVGVLGLALPEINNPQNLITVCEAHHRPPTGIHLNPNEIMERKERGEPYWNTDHDESLRLIAFGRTCLYLNLMGGDPFPV